MKGNAGAVHRDVQTALSDALSALRLGYVATEYEIGSLRADVVLHIMPDDPTHNMDKWAFEVKTHSERNNWKHIRDQFSKYWDYRYKPVLVGREWLFEKSGVGFSEPTKFGRKVQTHAIPTLQMMKYSNSFVWYWGYEKVSRILPEKIPSPKD